MIRIQNLNGGKNWYYSDLDLPDDKYCDEGDLLYAWSATFGPYWWRGPRAIYHYHIWKVLQSPELDRNFAFYAFDWVSEVVRDYAHGVTMVHMTKAGMEDSVIPLPPLPEQKRIAAILDKADEIRKKRAETIRLTEELLRSAFLEMFGDPVTNPKGWPVRKLGDESLCKVQGGLQVTRKREPNPIEVPYLRVANVYRDRLNLDEIKTMRVTEGELDRIRLVSGDVLIVEGHGNPQEIGRSSVWDGSIEDCVHQNHLIRVRCVKGRLSPTYLSAFLNSDGGRRQLIGFGKTTSGLNTISSGNVRAVSIPLPSIVIQEKFEKFLGKLGGLSKVLAVHATTSGGMATALTQCAFRGEL